MKTDKEKYTVEFMIYDYIKNHLDGDVYDGSFSKIAKDIGISKQLCRHHILNLIEKGKISRLKGLKMETDDSKEVG